jgi:preprotein translocase subunit SecF
MSTTTNKPAPTGEVKQATVLRRLFTSQTDYDFIGRSKLWLIVAIVLMLACLLGLALRGLNFNIDFTGGTSFIVENASGEFDTQTLREGLADLVEGDVGAQVVNDGAGALITTPAIGEVGGEGERAARARIAELTGTADGDIAVSSVGPRWGQQVSRQALEGLAVFLVLVVLYIALRFELRMALAALVTLLHDIVFTVGVYALVGFEVSPASVIALLTILGYSLYDTVVIFDRVTEDTTTITSTTNQTYGEVANHALNEVLVRSISTSLTSLLPVGSLLFIGGNLLGAETLTDLALALFVGMAIGTYSSIFVATPALVWLKERQPRYAEQKERILARRGGAAAAAAHAGSPAGARSGAAHKGGAAKPAGPKGAGRGKRAAAKKRRG